VKLPNTGGTGGKVDDNGEGRALEIANLMAMAGALFV
jgi:hypothetical protein